MNRRGLLLVASLLAIAGGRTALSQDLASDGARASDRRAADELLARPTTLDLTRASMSQAIDAAASSAQVIVQYRAQIVDAYTTPITLHLTNVPLRVALERILAGTTLHVVPDGATRLAVIDGAQRTETQPGLGSITGVVTDAATKRPLPGAAVTIDSTPAVRTRDNGMFTVNGVPAGPHRVVVRLIGYRSTTTPVVVHAGQTETIRIALAPSATTLTDVVTTATGDRRRLEVGNAVGTIKADSVVKTTLIRNMSDLLQARVPGVIVSNTDGAVGAPSKIRLRGVNSLALNNDPIIILDGVRINAQTTTASIQTNVGSPTMLPSMTHDATVNTPLAPSRLDDIDPNTIESIDVLRGPSASSLYGTDAANGVIVIKTKKGQAGSWRATLSGDAGQSYMPGQMPEMWFGWGHYNPVLIANTCNLAIGGFATVIGGTCHQDSVTHFNPQNNSLMRTMGTGTSQSLYGDLSGGTESLQQYFSLRGANDVGMAKMSIAEQRLIARMWNSPAPSWMVHPNTEQDIDGLSRTSVRIGSKADVSVTSTAAYRNVLNSGSGIQQVNQQQGASAADTLTYLPSESQRTKVTSLAKHGTLAAAGNYQPWSWLGANLTAGGDYALRTDASDLRAQDCTTLLIALQNGSGANCPSGHATTRGETFVSTVNGGASMSVSPLSWLNLRTSVGEQYSHTSFYSLQVGNSDPTNCPLAFGTTLLTPNPICTSSSMQPFAVNESRDEAATAGVYLEETIGAFGMYTTMGVRHDVASAFGGSVNKSPPNYPKFNISYPLSEQSFFPKQPYVSSLRLRVAYGQSGNQASRTAVLNNYTLTQTLFNSTSTPSSTMVMTQIGNTTLRPEKGTEWEGGIDASFLQDERIHVEATLYRKYTRDAISQITLAPSYGYVNGYYTNLGNVENRGLELTFGAKLLDSRLLGWDFTINATKNSNKLVHRAPTLIGDGPSDTKFREGYPLYGFWGVPVLAYADVNGDSILAQSEIKFGSPVFVGAPYPKAEIVYANNVLLLNGALRLSATFDQITGQTTRLSVLGSNFAPRGAVDRSAPLAEQAAYIQAALNNYAYLGTASSVRLNEVSMTYTVPVRIARRLLRVQSLAVTLAGRNVALWTNYAGMDPNVDTSGLLGEVSEDNALGTPQPRNWLLRFNLGL